jgi:hypothetical protein
MRQILVSALCCGTLLGQPKTSIPKLTRYFGLAPFGQPQAPATPRLNKEQLRKGLEERYAQTMKGMLAAGNITLLPGQPCSIPLLNVPRGNTNDRIAMPAPPDVDHMPAIAVPAPSCNDVKR